MTMRNLSLAALAVTALSGFAALPASAETIKVAAELTGAAEVPPNDSTGSGMLEASYDTESMELSWTVTYDGLTGPATATAAALQSTPSISAT